MSNIELPPNLQCKSAVHWICISCKPEIARIILAKGIDVNRLDHDGHMGPFYMLDVGDEDEVIEVFELLLQAGLDINKKTKTTSSILGEFVTSITKPLKIIEWLLAHGASMNSKLKTGQTIYEFMRHCEHSPELSVLAKKYENNDSKNT